MRKKKLLSLLFTPLAMLLLAACGNGADTADGDVFTIGTDTTFAPFEFENDDGDFVGIDLDILAAIAEDQGFKYELKPLGFNAAVTALEAKQVDGVIAGMSITPDREKTYDFSDPYYESTVGVAVTPDSGITTLEDLKGEQVVVKTGTTGADFAESVKDEYGFEVKYVEDSATMYQDVNVGNSKAAFEDFPVVKYEIARGMDLEVIYETEEGSNYGFATLKGEQTELVEMFNAGLKNLRDNGKYDEILSTYLD